MGRAGGRRRDGAWREGAWREGARAREGVRARGREAVWPSGSVHLVVGLRDRPTVRAVGAGAAVVRALRTRVAADRPTERGRLRKGARSG